MKSSHGQKDLRPSLSHRTCPICGSPRRRLIYKQHFIGSALLSGYDVVSCADCGFAYADVIPPQAAFDRYYRQCSKYEYVHHGGEVSRSDIKTFEQLADFICRAGVDRRSAILDVGCATGALLSVLGKRGFKNLHGMDPSPACAKTAARLYGIPVSTGSVFDLDPRHGRYDLIILSGVLEHLRDVRLAVQHIVDRLAPNGQLLLAVPDVMGLGSSRNAPFQQFSTEHINFFTAISLRNLMAVAGFERVAQTRMMRQQGIGTTEPAVAAIYRQALGPVKLRLDGQGRTALQRYVARSKKADRHTRKVIRHATRGGRKIVIWGVGTLTQRLLAAGILKGQQIAAFVDSSPKMQGRTLVGHRILAPAGLHVRPEPIVIASWMFQEEIYEQIKKHLRLPNKAIKLYYVRHRRP